MDTKESRPLNNLPQQESVCAATGPEDFQKLRARFLHLAQDILCNREAAVEVANKALEKTRNECKELSEHEDFIKWTQKVLDNEIENYFQKLVAEIKSGSEKSEGQLLSILKIRFLHLASKRIIWDKEFMATEDVSDIVQNALIVVQKRCRTAVPRETFLQWAQTILKNKHREYRRSRRRRWWQIGSPLAEKDEVAYTKTMSDVVIKGRKAKEVNENEIEFLQGKAADQFANGPFEDDPFRWDPILLAELSNLKENLLAIIKNMGEQCKRVFKVLFSEGDRKFMHEEFPDKTADQINVIVARCRKELKEKALKGGILQ